MPRKLSWDIQSRRLTTFDTSGMYSVLNPQRCLDLGIVIQKFDLPAGDRVP